MSLAAWTVIIGGFVAISTTWSGVALAYIVYRTKVMEKTIEVQAANIQKIETATNSMKDALIKSALESGEQKGIQVEKDRVKLESENKEAGAIEERKNPTV